MQLSKLMNSRQYDIIALFFLNYGELYELSTLLRLEPT